MTRGFPGARPCPQCTPGVAVRRGGGALAPDRGELAVGRAVRHAPCAQRARRGAERPLTISPNSPRSTGRAPRPELPRHRPGDMRGGRRGAGDRRSARQGVVAHRNPRMASCARRRPPAGRVRLQFLAADPRTRRLSARRGYAGHLSRPSGLMSMPPAPIWIWVRRHSREPAGPAFLSRCGRRAEGGLHPPAPQRESVQGERGPQAGIPL